MVPKPGPVYYPKYLDLSEDESARCLRQLELEAYAGIISALRSQGDLTKEKKALLTEVCACLGISEDRHRAEIRRAVNDEKLSTLALHNTGYESDVEWIKEGRRIVPLPHRPLQITAYMEEADRIAEITAKENASLINVPGELSWKTFTKREIKVCERPEEPAELAAKRSTKLYSSLYCAKCLTRQSEMLDASTSTDELGAGDVTLGKENALDVPSASDSCVFLPSGTVVRVTAGRQEKEELDAYALKPAGNFDFENAPEISLTGTRSTKRRRKKCIGSSTSKDGSVTIRQVIKPNATKEESGGGYGNQMAADIAKVKAEFPEARRRTDKPASRSTKSETRRRYAADDHPRRSSQERSSKRKKTLPQAVTIQHTPVPPEHLYAVGANAKPKQHQISSLSEEDEYAVPKSKPEYSVMNAQQSPTKQLGLYSSRISPLSPSYCYGLGPATWSSSARELAPNSESMTTYSHGFRYSPMKPFYRHPSIVQSSYGRSPKPTHPKRHRSSPATFSFTKKAMQAEIEHQSILKRISASKELGHTAVKGQDEVHMPHKMYRSNFRPGQFWDPVVQPGADSSGILLPTLETKIEECPVPPYVSHSSTLEELASVSLMASALNTSSIVETGLAPVSAIVSRVTSPAPGQISSVVAAKKSTTKPLVVSKIQTEEGFAPQSQKIIHTPPGLPPRQGSALINLTPGATKLKSPGTVTGQHPNITHQVRLAVTSYDNGTITSVPICFTNAVPPSISSPTAQSPRVISTIAGKPHTVLKSSTGNVITVAAKPLPGVKTSASSLVGGTNIVKPQIGQKTSIIVVHKAAGSKFGKTVPTSFPTLGSEGSKVITVRAKNLLAPVPDVPRVLAESTEEGSSESALGSIQGLVSGLNPPGIVKKAKVVGAKPKFVTAPLPKKTIGDKMEETAKPKVIQNIIKAPAKVLVKASSGSMLSTAQLRTIPTTRVVKPIISQTPTMSLPQDQASLSQDIVAAALSQSLGASAVCPDEKTVTSPEDPSNSNIIKVATSTPAASTIKAFAATYQKNSSTSQQRLISSSKQPSSVTTISPTVQDRTKVFLATSPSQPKPQPMLFTPNQPQVHRSPQGGSVQRPKSSYLLSGKPNALPGSTAAYLASVGNLPKSTIKPPGTRMLYQQTPQQPVMQVKVISHPPTSPQTPAQQWQATSLLGKGKPGQKDVDETTAQTKILQDIMDSSSYSQAMPPRPQSHPSTMAAGDRATFIYQYHPTPKLGTKPGPVPQTGTLPIAMSSMDTGDVITLHSVGSDATLTSSKSESGESRFVQKPNLVKISLSSIRTPSPTSAPSNTMPMTPAYPETSQSQEANNYSFEADPAFEIPHPMEGVEEETSHNEPDISESAPVETFSDESYTSDPQEHSDSEVE